MNKLQKAFQYITDSNYRFCKNAKHGLYNKLSDEEFLKRFFKIKMGYELNLDNPKSFNEKLQWLKIHDHNPVYSVMVDKYEAKQYVAKVIGEEYIIPTYGVWDRFEDIDFDSLPFQFVLKCTHDSGGVIVCNDKRNFNFSDARKKINSCLKKNYYYMYREYPYNSIKPRIIAEKYLENTYSNSEGHLSIPNDYKLQCFDGKFDNIFVAEGRISKRRVRYNYFDRKWNYLPYSSYDNLDHSFLQNLKPKCFEEMIEIAEKLSAGFPQMRVDLYEVDGKVYFGELTFFTQSGFDTSITHEADCLLGEKLRLHFIK